MSYAGLKSSQLYLSMSGRTVLSPMKAPFLKLNKYLEFEVPPSGNIQRGGNFSPFSTFSCLLTICYMIWFLISSDAPLGINID